MGGDGSGRKADPTKKLLGVNQPAPTDGTNTFYLPNYSGVQKAALKTSPPLTGGSPGGPEGSVQFNSGSTFGGDVGLLYSGGDLLVQDGNVQLVDLPNGQIWTVSQGTGGTKFNIVSPQSATIIQLDRDSKSATFDGAIIGTNVTSGTDPGHLHSVYAISGAYVPMAISGGFTALSGALISNGTITATSGEFNTAVTDANFVYLTSADTLTNKSISLATNTLTGTSGAFDTACTDANFSYTTHTHPAYTSGAFNVIFVAASGAVISGGAKADIYVPFNCTLTSYTLLADQNGTANVEAWKDTYANFPPTSADTLFSGGMVLSGGSSNKYQDTTLATWNKTINANDILRLNLSGSTTSVTRLTVALAYTKP